MTDLHSQPAAPVPHRHSPLARVGLGWFVLLVIYASLYPFAGWTDTGVSPFAFLTAPLPRYNTGFDLMTNVWGYMPLGMLTVLALHPRITGWRAVLLALLAGLLLSGAMEAIQTYLPTRISSNVDLATNTIGALLGGIVMAPFAGRLIDRGGLRGVRKHWFEPHATFAILLLLLWPFAQTFPQEFLFSMGGVVRSMLLDPSPDAFLTSVIRNWFPDLFDWHDQLQAHPEALQRQELLEALITACSWVGTALLATVTMRRGAPMLPLLAALLTSTLLLKAGATLLQFPLAGAWDWLSSGALWVGGRLARAGAAGASAALAAGRVGDDAADCADCAVQRAAAEPVFVGVGASLAAGALRAFQQPVAVDRLVVAVPGAGLPRLARRADASATARRASGALSLYRRRHCARQRHTVHDQQGGQCRNVHCRHGDKARAPAEQPR